MTTMGARRRFYRDQTWRWFADQLGVRYCESPIKCRDRGSQVQHDKGYVDNAGYVHWSSMGKRYHRLGMRRFMMLAAYSVNRKQYRNEPAWLALYHASTWARETALTQFKTRIPARASRADRERVHRMAIKAKIGFRFNYPSIYFWTRRTRPKT